MPRRRRTESEVLSSHLSRVFDTSAPMTCPACAAVAVVPLPASLLAMQSDGTTHVCLPGGKWKGCNAGYRLVSA